jgi:hypothetical protein
MNGFRPQLITVPSDCFDIELLHLDGPEAPSACHVREVGVRVRCADDDELSRSLDGEMCIGEARRAIDLS